MVALLEPVLAYLAARTRPVATAEVVRSVPPADRPDRSHRHAVWHALVILEREGRVAKSAAMIPTASAPHSKHSGWSNRLQRQVLWELTPAAREDERLVTAREGAAAAGCKRKTIDYWASTSGGLRLKARGVRGRFKVYRLGDIKTLALVGKNPAMMETPEGYYSRAEAAGVLGCYSDLFTKLARGENLPVVEVRYGKSNVRRYFLKTAVDALAARRKAEADGPAREEFAARPLIYFRDDVCLAARRELWAAAGRVWPGNSVDAGRGAG